MKHWLFFLLFTCAALIRFWDLSNTMIFIGDQGRDFQVARAVVQEHVIPLLGIPSSIPRFSQGPLFIYMLSFLHIFSDTPLLGAGIVSALFSLASIVLLYLFLLRYFTKRLATDAVALYAFLPMLLQHSRMPYHIVPLPFFVIFFLWQACRYAQGEKWSGYLLGLSFALVFQFELAAFPLLCVVFWLWTKQRTTASLVSILSGVASGLLPQILYDLTHNFAQLGGFLVWVPYKIASSLTPFTHNSIVTSPSGDVYRQLWSMFLSIFSQNTILFDPVFWGLVSVCAGIFCFYSFSAASPYGKIVIGSYGSMICGLFIHHVPSEAYMPILAPLSVVCLSFCISQMHAKGRVALLSLFFVSLSASVIHSTRSRYFLLVDQDSDWEFARFGPSIGKQRQIAARIRSLAGGSCVCLASSERDRTFPNLYAHIEYVLHIPTGSCQSTCTVIHIDRPTIAKKYWPSYDKSIDLGAYWIQRETDMDIVCTQK